jgi:hypothetical protein
LLPVIEEAGADPVIEWGTLSAGILGLQVARVCADADGAWLEIGIGEHDRLGRRLLWGDEPSPEALSGVVNVALEARRTGASPPPRSARPRAWLRHRVVEDPSPDCAGRLVRRCPTGGLIALLPQPRGCGRRT